MADRERLRTYNLSCRGKQMFGSYRDAEHRARVMSHREGDALVAYHCRFCGGYHVGNNAGSTRPSGYGPGAIAPYRRHGRRLVDLDLIDLCDQDAAGPDAHEEGVDDRPAAQPPVQGGASFYQAARLAAIPAA